MKLEVSIQEVQEFLQLNYQIDIELKNIEENKIEISYYATLLLIIKKVSKTSITFGYELNSFLNFLAKGAHLYFENKLDNIPIVWNSDANELKIDLTKVDALKNFLKYASISNLQFNNDKIILGLVVKPDK